MDAISVKNNYTVYAHDNGSEAGCRGEGVSREVYEDAGEG